MKITFGDNIRIIASKETDALGLTGKEGQVYGGTTPSVTSVVVVGVVEEDYALLISFDDLDQEVWIAPHLVDFIDHGAGAKLVIGNVKAVRRADGSWKELTIIPKGKWWEFWR